MTIAENLSFFLSTGTTTTSVPSNLVVGSLTIGTATFTNSNIAPQTYQTTGNGLSYNFSLPFTPSALTGLIATIDGIAEYDYSLNGNTVTFNFVPANNTIIRFFSTGVPGLVSTATLGPGTVTSSSFAAGAILASLGYTPANKNGDTFSGTFVLSGSSTINGWSINTGTSVAQAVTATYAATAYSLASTATAYQYTSGTNVTSALTPAVVWAAASPVTLTDASSITIDMSTGFNFSLLTTSGVGSTRTLANPANIKPGQTGWISVTQSSSGNNAVAFGTNWHFSTGTVTTVSNSANAVDLIYYTAVTNSYLLTTIAKYWF